MVEQRYIINNFLMTNFPIKRIKKNGRFRRSIILDSEIYQLNDLNNRTTLKKNLKEVIMVVFGCDKTITKSIVDDFLI